MQLPFAEGDRIVTLIETIGDDHRGIEHKVPAGATGFVDAIDLHPKEDNATYTVVIKTPADDPESHIVNSYDKSDGAITDLIRRPTFEEIFEERALDKCGSHRCARDTPCSCRVWVYDRSYMIQGGNGT
jgi:hypothetical protein